MMLYLLSVHRCDHGILKNLYSSGELEPYSGHLNCSFDDWENEKWLSLREAAKLQSPWNLFTENVCKCKTGCFNMKCRCVQKGISCSSHCHSGKNCCNKKYDNEKNHIPIKKRLQKRKFKDSFDNDSDDDDWRVKRCTKVIFILLCSRFLFFKGL